MPKGKCIKFVRRRTYDCQQSVRIDKLNLRVMPCVLVQRLHSYTDSNIKPSLIKHYNIDICKFRTNTYREANYLLQRLLSHTEKPPTENR